MLARYIKTILGQHSYTSQSKQINQNMLHLQLKEVDVSKFEIFTREKKWQQIYQGI
jgi:hypothetical protein